MDITGKHQHRVRLTSIFKRNKPPLAPVSTSVNHTILEPSLSTSASSIDPQHEQEAQSSLVPEMDQTISTTTQPTLSVNTTGNSETLDRERTKERFIKACKFLSEAVKGKESRWGVFDFPELAGEPENSSLTQFKNNINNSFRVRRRRVRDATAWEKCEHAIECFFTAFSPFAKAFLTVAKEGQSVHCSF